MTESVKVEYLVGIGALEDAPIRVLHVDDETGFLKVAQQILETQGSFEVDIASSVEEAWKKMKKATYDTIVSDYQMPRKDGLQFLKELREKGNTIPFIIFTGKGREEIAIKALNLGADQYLSKIGAPETVYGELAHSIQRVVKGIHAEEELRKSEEKYRVIVESAADAIYEFNEDGELLSANQQAATVLGRKPEDLIGKRMYDIFPTAIADQHREALKAVFQTGKPILSRESQTSTKSGLRWVNTSLIPIKDGNGKTVKVLGFSRDITELKIGEEELKKSAIYLDMMVDALMVLSPDANLVKVNNAFSEIWGYSPEEIVGTSVFELFTEEEIPKYRREMEIAAKTGGKRIFETVALTKNGNKIPVSVNGIFLKDANGKPLNFIASFRDITKRKQTEEKLSQSEKKYRNIVELSPDGLAVLNMKGFVTSINPAFSKLTGFSKEEIVGKHFTKLGTLRMRDLPMYLKLFRSMIRGRLPDVPEFTYVRKDGSIRSGDARFEFLVEDGRRVGVQAVFRDITERKKAEESVNKTLTKLKELNEKLEVIGSLTRHDIRNKLTTILGRVFLANQKLGGNIEAQEDLVETQRAVKEAVRILDFAKEYESLGKEELAYVSVGNNVKSAVALLPMAGAELEGVKIIEQNQNLRVLADSMLQQLFYNLIDNSLKHGENVNQIKIYHKTGKNDLKLIYEDDGVGVSKAEKKRIFEKGYGKGTGYGLYLIKKVCEVYGWTIKETGKQGKGAQFAITIPKMNENGKENYHLP